MDNQEQNAYSVEYEMSGVLFYKTVLANSFEDAKRQISQQNPHLHIRAVTILDKPSHKEGEEQQETKL